MILFRFMLLFASAVTLAKPFELCPNISVTDGKIKLNANERALVCGSEKGTAAWRDIPVPQSQLHLNSILSNLGYLNSTFERQDNRLIVTKGPVQRIEKFDVMGADGLLIKEKKRKVLKKALTPEVLNDIEAWANLGIRSRGHACPEVKVTAQAYESSVLVEAKPGLKQKYGPIEYSGLDSLNPDLLDRYRPFEEGEEFDIRQTSIMTSRLLMDGLFQSAYFVIKCQGEVARLRLESSIGKPKIFRFGVGASTEELPFLDATVRNARLDSVGSNFTITAHVSPIRQSLIGTSELYFFQGWHRTFWGPRFDLKKENFGPYEDETVKLGADIGRNWDQWRMRFNVRGGPSFNTTKTIRGTAANAAFPTLDGQFTVMSHNYEATLRDQFEGWVASGFYQGQGKGLGSTVTINRYEANFKHLWNLGEFSPPLLVLGTRLEGIAVDTDALEPGQPGIQAIPRQQRVFLGGDDNVRGFPVKGIDNEGLGYLTSLYLGVELRLIEELPFHLQPFLLWDGAKVGTGRMSLDRATFISEGAGLRWASPFGTLRFWIARGRIINQDITRDSEPEKLNFFLSFGQEF